MDLSDLFAINRRVRGTRYLVKQVDQRMVSKRVPAKFNWLAFIFTAFYAVFSRQYRTRGFIAKLFGDLLLLVLINCGLSYLFEGSDWLWNIIEAVYFGSMFDTWYYNQLRKNGYREDPNHPPADFE